MAAVIAGAGHQAGLLVGLVLERGVVGVLAVAVAAVPDRLLPADRRVAAARGRRPVDARGNPVVADEQGVVARHAQQHRGDRADALLLLRRQRQELRLRRPRALRQPLGGADLRLGLLHHRAGLAAARDAGSARGRAVGALRFVDRHSGRRAAVRGWRVPNAQARSRLV